MNWLRMTGLLTLILSCSAGGLLAGSRLRQRIADLEGARALLWGFSRRLGYTLAPPAQLAEELAAQEESRRLDYLLMAVEETGQGQLFEAAWRSGLRHSRCTLDAGDRALLEQAGSILGAFDLETQQNQLALLAERLETRLATARTRCESSAKLASTLGVLLGLGLAVLII